MTTFTLMLDEALYLLGCELEEVDGQTVLLHPELAGLAHYPIHDEDYRPVLNGLIVDRYRFREIGFETVGMFRQKLRSRMNEIMPYYSKLYRIEQIDDATDPLTTIDMHTQSSGESVGKSDATSTSMSETNSGSRAVTSNTPQDQLSGHGDYASGATDQTGKTVADGTQNNLSENEGSEQSESHVTGRQGSSADILARYRDSVVSVNEVLLDQLDTLFMQIYDIDTPYTNRYRSL